MFRSVARAVLLAASIAVMPSPAASAAAKPLVEVTFVLDTTGSMGPLIEGAKRKIWSIATAIADANPDAEIRMGLVVYRDIGDEYVTKIHQLTTDIQDLYANLLEMKARGGGDWPESVNEALAAAVSKLSWSASEEASKIIFLVGDAPPHMDYPQDTKYPEVLATARAKGIIVNAVQAGGARDTERFWRMIAQMGSGRYIPIPQDGGHVVIIETPFDEEIIELQGEINGTVIPYGPRAVRAGVERKMGQVAAAPTASASDMASYLNKRAVAGHSDAVTGSGDLVADVASGRRRTAEVNDDELPEKLRKMSVDERRASIASQMKRRKALNAHMAELVRKRDQYVRDRSKKSSTRVPDSFDRAVAGTLKAQIGR